MAGLYNIFVASIFISLQNIESQDTREFAENSNIGYSELYEFIGELQQKNVQLEARISDNEVRLEVQMTIIGNQGAQLDALRNQSDDTSIAFTAVAHEIAYKSYNLGDVVQFEEAYTNIGGHYNTSTGVFTCPLNGVYGFFTNVRSAASSYVLIQLMHEGRALTAAITSNASYEQGSTMAVVECLFGQHVWVQAYNSRTIQSNPVGYTSFSGFLIGRY